MLTYITQTPVDDEITEITIRFSMIALDDELATAAIAELNDKVTNEQFTQDVPIWENKIYRDKPAAHRRRRPGRPVPPLVPPVLLSDALGPRGGGPGRPPSSSSREPGGRGPRGARSPRARRAPCGGCSAGSSGRCGRPRPGRLPARLRTAASDAVVVVDRGGAVHPHPVRLVEVDEEQADLRVGHDVAEAAEHAVAVVARELERAGVDHAHEAGHAALVGAVGPAVRRRRSPGRTWRSARSSPGRRR